MRTAFLFGNIRKHFGAFVFRSIQFQAIFACRLSVLRLYIDFFETESADIDGKWHRCVQSVYKCVYFETGLDLRRVYQCCVSKSQARTSAQQGDVIGECKRGCPLDVLLCYKSLDLWGMFLMCISILDYIKFIKAVQQCKPTWWRLKGLSMLCIYS